MLRIDRAVRKRWHRQLFRGAAIVAIGGIALGLHGLLDTFLDTGFHRSRAAGVHALVVCASSVMALIAYGVNHRNEKPSEWMIFVMVCLIWAAILLNRAR